MPPQPLTPAAAPAGPGTAFATRILVPLWLLVIVGYQVMTGTNEALPVWLQGLALRFSLDPLTILRAMIWVEIATAVLIFFFPRWSRRLAIVALLMICFSALASISASIGTTAAIAEGGSGTLAITALALAISGTLLAIALRGIVAPSESNLSLQWQVITTVALLAASGVVAGQVPLRAVEPTLRVAGTAGGGSTKRPTNVIEMDFAAFVGQPVAATPLARFFGQLTARTLEGRRIVVFYNPDCGSCHDLFKEHFATAAGSAGPAGGADGGTAQDSSGSDAPDRTTPVLAVKVPPPPNADRLPSDQPAEVDCADCEFLDLPVGPLYLMTPPVVMITDDGVITCVADQRTVEECLGTTESK